MVNIKSHAMISVTDILHHFTTLFERWLPHSADGEADLRQVLDELESAGEPQSFQAVVPPVVEEWLEKSCVLPCLPQHQALIQALLEMGGSLRWFAPSADYAGDEMVQSYAFVRLIGPPLFGQEAAPFLSDNVIAGFTLQAPNILYPSHWHLAVEFYDTLSGTGLWQIGDGPFEAKPPGTLIHHPSNAPHAMQTTDTPMLNAFCWVGDILTRPVVAAGCCSRLLQKDLNEDMAESERSEFSLKPTP